MQKLYLNRILGRPQGGDVGSAAHGRLQLFKPTVRTLVGKVLSSSPELGTPGPYIPLHLKACTFSNISKVRQVSIHVVTHI